jgi:hypothetical protein
MSMPTVPNQTPTIKLKQKEVAKLLIASIAEEELALAHILNAEGEKLQEAVATHDMKTIMEANASVAEMVKLIISKEALLLSKLETATKILLAKEPCDD